MADIQRITRACVIHILRLIFIHQAVVGMVINAAERNGRTQVVSLSRVVIDHIQNDLDTSGMVGAHHRFKLRHGAAGGWIRGIVLVGSKESESVVTPVITQAYLAQAVILQKLMDRKKLNSGNP